MVSNEHLERVYRAISWPGCIRENVGASSGGRVGGIPAGMSVNEAFEALYELKRRGLARRVDRGTMVEWYGLPQASHL